MNGIDSERYVVLLFFTSVAAFHGIWIALLLFRRRSVAFKYLGLSIICISSYLVNYLLFLSGYIANFPHLLSVLYLPVYMVGPYFYLFVQKATGTDVGKRVPNYLHGLPLLFGIINSWQILFASEEIKSEVIRRLLTLDYEYDLFSFIRSNILVFFLLLYAWLSWRIVAGSKNQLLKSVCGLFIGFVVADGLIKMLFFTFGWDGIVMEFTLAIFLGIILHVIGYIAMDQGISPEKMEADLKNKYQTIVLTANQLQVYNKALIEFMEQSKSYLNSDLRLTDISRALQIPTPYLSQLLNEYMNTNFNDFINEYRIKEVIIHLQRGDQKRYSLQSIGLDCGFSNKTTFYRAFKKITGTTPNEYVKNYLSS